MNAYAHEAAADRRAAHLDALTARIGAHPTLDATTATILCEAVDPDTLTADEIRADLDAIACNTL